MFGKIRFNKHFNKNEQLKAKEKLETSLHKLQKLKSQISELILQCEELKKLFLENKSKESQCCKCGEATENQED